MGLHVRLADFFLIFKYGPTLQQSVSYCLASGCLCFWKTKLLKFWGSVLPPILPEDQVDQIFGGRGLVPSRERPELDQIVGVRTGSAGGPT